MGEWLKNHSSYHNIIINLSLWNPHGRRENEINKIFHGG